MMTQRRIQISAALATFAACLILLPFLGHRPLTDWDEGIYAEISREMLAHGWLVPFWNQAVWLEKPPLMLWITAVFFKIFGVSDFWARAGSALSGAALVGLLHGWMALKKDALTAWLSTLILLGTFGFLHACHVGELDILLSLGCAIAMIGLTQIDELSLSGWYLFWVGFAIALMTKGAASVVIPLTMVCVAVLRRWRARHLSAACWLGLLVFLLLTLPWHLAMLHFFGDRFLDEYLGLHVWARATRPIEGHLNPWWFYLKVILVSAAPFVLVFPPAWLQALRRPQLRVWAVFSAVVLIFYTIVQTRLAQYMAPIYPALAVITASWLGERIHRLLAEHRPRAFWIKLSLATVAVSVASIAITTPAHRTLRIPTLAIGTGSKESSALLRKVCRQPQPVAEPLLVWRNGSVPIVTDVFYSRRQLQQVQLLPLAPGVETNRYAYNPVPLRSAVDLQPRLILLDKSLVPQMPGDLLYTPIESAKLVEVGSIVRAH